MLAVSVLLRKPKHLYGRSRLCRRVILAIKSAMPQQLAHVHRRLIVRVPVELQRLYQPHELRENERVRFVVAYRGNGRLRRDARRRKLAQIGTQRKPVVYQQRLDGSKKRAAPRNQPRVEHGKRLRKRLQFGFGFFDALKQHGNEPVLRGERFRQPVVVAVVVHLQYYAFIYKIAHYAPYAASLALCMRLLSVSGFLGVLGFDVHRVIMRLARSAEQIPQKLFVVFHIAPPYALLVCNGAARLIPKTQ